MLRSIAVTYGNGTVQLTEIPTNIRSSKVIVTFLDSVDANPKNQFITLDMYSGTKQSTIFPNYGDRPQTRLVAIVFKRASDDPFLGF
jgi:hypothetical protein